MKKGLYKSTICANREIVPDIYLTTFEIQNCKADIQPGQFLHLLCPDFPGFHLRRPFTIFGYSTNESSTKVSILYERVGRITNYLSKSVGPSQKVRLPTAASTTEIELLMPLGLPFKIAKEKRTVFVSGGLGIAAFGILKEQIKSDTVLLYGVRSKEFLVDLNLFKNPFTEVKYSTDDGSFGRKGFVTLLLEEDLKKYVKESVYYICGPDPMMANCFLLLKKYGAKAYFSLENKMGCALNVCRACVVKVKNKKTNGFKMATCCTDGPNFSIDQLPDTGWW